MKPVICLIKEKLKALCVRKRGVVGVRDKSIDCDWLIVEWGNLYYEGFFFNDWDLRDVWANTFDSTEDVSAFPPNQK